MNGQMKRYIGVQKDPKCRASVSMELCALSSQQVSAVLSASTPDAHPLSLFKGIPRVSSVAPPTPPPSLVDGAESSNP